MLILKFSYLEVLELKERFEILTALWDIASLVILQSSTEDTKNEQSPVEF